MSIYATYWILKFPRFGDAHSGCEWIEVIGQGVPGHIGTPTPGHGYDSGDPYGSFLPPPIPVPDDYDGTPLRAMVIVREGAEEKVSKESQEYARPLLVMSGSEYTELSFPELHERICDSLRGDRSRFIGQWVGNDGSRRVMFEDGSVQELPPDASDWSE